MDGKSGSIRMYRMQAEAWNSRTDYDSSHHGLRASIGSSIYDPFMPMAPSVVYQARDDWEENGADFWS